MKKKPYINILEFVYLSKQIKGLVNLCLVKVVEVFEEVRYINISIGRVRSGNIRQDVV